MAVAQWPMLEHVTLSWQDLDVGACNVLGVCRAIAARCRTSAQLKVSASLINKDHVFVYPEGCDCVSQYQNNNADTLDAAEEILLQNGSRLCDNPCMASPLVLWSAITTLRFVKKGRRRLKKGEGS